jgi:hypothetical protein
VVSLAALLASRRKFWSACSFSARASGSTFQRDGAVDTPSWAL